MLVMLVAVMWALAVEAVALVAVGELLWMCWAAGGGLGSVVWLLVV